MNNRIQIPPEWWKYRNQSAFFITYFGEIYFGVIIDLPQYPDRIFIVQNDKLTTLRDLQPHERTLIKYQELGREIRDIRAIKKVIESQFENNIEHKELWHHSEDFKRMFVFGAAASAFSVFGDKLAQFRQQHLAPPTGYEIFDEKYNQFIGQFPAAKISIPLFESMGKDIEECMEQEWQHYKAFYAPEIANRHLNLQYYMQTLIAAISKETVANHFRNNLYSLFLNKLQKYLGSNQEERISLVSFNYDTILDDFISQIFHRSFNNMDDYIDYKSHNLLLFKPHGSCNWGWKLNPAKLNGNTQTTIAEALYNGKVEPWQVYFDLIGKPEEVIAKNTWGIEWGNDEHYRGRFTINKNLLKIIPEKSHEVFFPALLLPYRDKDEMLMPYDHYYALTGMSMQDVEEIYLIGWKGNEKLFVKYMKQSSRLRKIIIVNPEPKVVETFLQKCGLDISKYQIEHVRDFETFVLKEMDKRLTENHLVNKEQ